MDQPDTPAELLRTAKEWEFVASQFATAERTYQHQCWAAKVVFSSGLPDGWENMSKNDLSKLLEMTIKQSHPNYAELCDYFFCHTEGMGMPHVVAVWSDDKRNNYSLVRGGFYVMFQLYQRRGVMNCAADDDTSSLLHYPMISSLIGEDATGQDGDTIGMLCDKVVSDLKTGSGEVVCELTTFSMAQNLASAGYAHANRMAQAFWDDYHNSVDSDDDDEDGGLSSNTTKKRRPRRTLADIARDEGRIAASLLENPDATRDEIASQLGIAPAHVSLSVAWKCHVQMRKRARAANRASASDRLDG